jgi:murein DD-endopeptidase MepM/ murein hydrolase activator NlpD
MFMRCLFVLLLGCYTSLAHAQQEVKVYTAQKGSTTILYAANAGLCPASVQLDTYLDNMRAVRSSEKVFVVPERTEAFKLCELTPMNPTRPYSFKYNYKFVLGNVLLQQYDSTYDYDLPYRPGAGHLVYQGYNGSFSHQGQYALDFIMPEGTEILAAREGVVVKVVQSNSLGCAQESCKQYGNYIQIYHRDGTFAEYIHLRKDGARVRPGDYVQKGDVIGYSGNTGWSSGPHLHFDCFLAGWESRKTIMTKFRIGDGNTAGYLKESETYSRGY